MRVREVEREEWRKKAVKSILNRRGTGQDYPSFPPVQGLKFGPFRNLIISTFDVVRQASISGCTFRIRTLGVFWQRCPSPDSFGEIIFTAWRSHYLNRSPALPHPLSFKKVLQTNSFNTVLHNGNHYPFITQVEKRNYLSSSCFFSPHPLFFFSSSTTPVLVRALTNKYKCLWLASLQHRCMFVARGGLFINFQPWKVQLAMNGESKSHTLINERTDC